MRQRRIYSPAPERAPAPQAGALFAQRSFGDQPSQPAPAPRAQAEQAIAASSGHSIAAVTIHPSGPTPPIQAKLAIGQPDDPHEQEADRVAAQVVTQLHAPTPRAAPGGASRSRPKPVEPHSAGRTGDEAPADLSAAIRRASGGGQPLDAGLQAAMGQAIGADFRRVRVHTSAQADQLSQSIQARAFTTGRDVFFRRGAYQPASRAGQRLIAHELTHVAQQRGQPGDTIRRDPLNSASGIKPGTVLLWATNKQLVKVLGTEMVKGGIQKVKAQVIWPKPKDTPDLIKHEQLDDGNNNADYARLHADWMQSETEKKQKLIAAKAEEKQLKADQAADPRHQWARQTLGAITRIEKMISAELEQKTDKGGVVSGVNKLDAEELKWAREYGKAYMKGSKDPYIAVKKLDDGRCAVLSNQGTLVIYPQGDKRNINLGTGKSVHCEAALNAEFPKDKSAAKATKAEGGEVVGGAASQNCLLCSLDARARGLAYDPHQNAPKFWNYHVLAPEGTLFAADLRGAILSLLQPIIAGMPAEIAVEIRLGKGDQEIVDAISRLYSIADGIIGGN